MFKKGSIVLTVALLLLIFLLGCGDIPWKLIDEGILTSIGDFNGRPALTFESTRVILLNSGFSFEAPSTITVGKYYYLYKEDASFLWNGYSLTENKK